MRQNEAIFDSKSWEWEIMRLVVIFHTVDNFLNDEQARNTYSRQEYTAKAGNSLFTLSSNSILLAGAQVFRRQTIVLLKTYLEQIIKDFLINVFIGQPQKMAKYLLLEELKDIQTLEELEKILGENTTTSLKELPQSAATRAMRGKFSKILNKVEEISGAKIKKSTKENLIKLNEVRTHIVHEMSYEEIEKDFLNKCLGAAQELIASLRDVCAINNVADRIAGASE